MMKTAYKALLAILLAALLALCFFLPSALADATEVWVNNVQLTSSLPYWYNGEAAARATAPDGLWNAYFNTADSSVTLRNAVMDTMHTWISTYQGMLYANGDITVTLLGHSTLLYAQVTTNRLYGMKSDGSLTITGSGSAEIQVHNTSTGTLPVFALASTGNLTVQGGTFDINLLGASNVYGLFSERNILYAGGTAVITARGGGPRAAYTDFGTFRMTGGSLSAALESTYSTVRGIFAQDAYLEGGTGSFVATGVGSTRGMLLSPGPLHVSGGFFRFSGESEALCIHNPSYVLDIDPSITVLVSEEASGAGMRLWTSAADGVLAGYNYMAVTSPFRFVQFGRTLATAAPPQTGDAARPWLWAGIALLGAAGLTAAVRRGARWATKK